MTSHGSGSVVDSGEPKPSFSVQHLHILGCWCSSQETGQRLLSTPAEATSSTPVKHPLENPVKAGLKPTAGPSVLEIPFKDHFPECTVKLVIFFFKQMLHAITK